MGKSSSKKSARTFSCSSSRLKLFSSVSALNPGQKNALRAIASKDNYIIFIDGPAGGGKTYISASWGLEHLLNGSYERIIITRPMVEAGENMGYLPGDISSKTMPYTAPVFDILGQNIDQDQIKDLIEENKIITLPIAFMRGVTFRKAFVILDEAQNCTPKQMHLFLTRIGQDSKVVVTGDTKQSDLGPNNGFIDALSRLTGVSGLEIVTLDQNAIVRHEIIPIINARYNKKE